MNIIVIILLKDRRAIKKGQVKRERDQVFIGNQREQLQEEPAQVPSCHMLLRVLKKAARR